MAIQYIGMGRLLHEVRLGTDEIHSQHLSSCKAAVIYKAVGFIFLGSDGFWAVGFTKFQL